MAPHINSVIVNCRKIFRFACAHAQHVITRMLATSNPGPFDIEAAREKALVKSGHVTPQILDIA